MENERGDLKRGMKSIVRVTKGTNLRRVVERKVGVTKINIGSIGGRALSLADNCEMNTLHPPPTSSHSSTFGAYGADEQLRPAPGPRGRSQHGQATRGAFAHEQPHRASEPTLMQPERVSRFWVNLQGI